MPMSVAEWELFEGGPMPRPFEDRGPSATSVRRALFKAQEGVCALCGKSMGTASRSVDHVIPKRMNGANRVGNLVISHYGCNFAKADRAPTGCELVWLLAVNNRLGVEPQRW